MEKDYLKMAEEGVIANLKILRDTLYPGQNAYDCNIIGLTDVGKFLKMAKHIKGFWEVATKKCEILGVLYYHKPWKAYVWQARQDTIMNQGCLNDAFAHALKHHKDS